MIKPLALTCLIAVASAAGPPFTLHPKGQEDHCVDVAPLSGSDRSYTTLQPCKFDGAGKPVLSQTFMLETVDPLERYAPPEMWYGHFPDGSRGCIGDVSSKGSPDEEAANPYKDNNWEPPRVTACPAAGAAGFCRWQWGFSNDDGSPEGQFRHAKPGKYGSDLALDLRPLKRTGHGELQSPVFWSIKGKPSTQRWIVKLVK